jgi:hypothetical protein
MANDKVPSYDVCNARKGSADTSKLSKEDPGEWAGEGHCKNLAGKGTDHKGYGRCSRHGGAGGNKKSHGLYSFRREELREKFANADTKEQPGDLWTEVAVVRALIADYLENIEGAVSAEDMHNVEKLMSELRKQVDGIHQMAMRSRPTEQEVRRMTAGMAQIIKDYVPKERREGALSELEDTVGLDRRSALPSGREHGGG